jgi:hypothetical protein
VGRCCRGTHLAGLGWEIDVAFAVLGADERLAGRIVDELKEGRRVGVVERLVEFGPGRLGEGDEDAV